MKLQHRVLTKQRTNKVHDKIETCKFTIAKIQNT